MAIIPAAATKESVSVDLPASILYDSASTCILVHQITMAIASETLQQREELVWSELRMHAAAATVCLTQIIPGKCR